MHIGEAEVSCGFVLSPSNQPSLALFDPLRIKPTSLQDLDTLQVQHLQIKRTRPVTYLSEANTPKEYFNHHRVISENIWTTRDHRRSYFVSSGRDRPTSVTMVSSCQDHGDNTQGLRYALPGSNILIPLCRSISGHSLARVVDGSYKSYSLYMMDAYSSRSWRSSPVDTDLLASVLVCPITGAILSSRSSSFQLARPSMKD